MELESYSVESKGRQSSSQKTRLDGVRLQQREGRAPLRRPGRMELESYSVESKGRQSYSQKTRLDGVRVILSRIKGKAELLSEDQAGWS